MQNNPPMFEVWWSQGDGTHRGPRFRRLDDAIRYVEARGDDASYAIKGPVGFWYQGADGRSIFDRRS